MRDRFPRELVRNQFEALGLLQDIRAALNASPDQRLFLLRNVPGYAAQRAKGYDKARPALETVDRHVLGPQ